MLGFLLSERTFGVSPVIFTIGNRRFVCSFSLHLLKLLKAEMQNLCQSLDISLSLNERVVVVHKQKKTFEASLKNKPSALFLASVPLQGEELMRVEWGGSQVFNRSFSGVWEISSYHQN